MAVFFLVCFFKNSFAFNGPNIPREVPFTENNVTYTSYIQTWHPWYNSSTIIYFPENVDSALHPVGADYNQGAPYQHIRILLNPASFSQAWDSTAYNPNAYYYIWHAGMQAWIYHGQSASLEYAQYTWFDWNYAGPTGYDLREDLVRVYGVDLKINFSYNWNGQFGLSALTTGDYILQSPPASEALTVSNDPEVGGGVTVTVPPGFPEYQCGIDSEEECDFEVDYNAQVTLEAQANSGYAFSHWEINNQTMGDVDGTIVISMSEDKDVVAVYARTFQDTAGNFDVTAGDECVIYVRSETGIIYDACHGDAADCFEQAQAAGYATGSEPRESAIIVFDRVPDTALAVGHVGIVTSYNGDYVSMHDSNWVGYHTIGNHTELIGENGYSIKGYIYFTPHQ